MVVQAAISVYQDRWIQLNDISRVKQLLSILRTFACPGLPRRTFACPWIPSLDSSIPGFLHPWIPPSLDSSIPGFLHKSKLDLATWKYSDICPPEFQGINSGTLCARNGSCGKVIKIGSKGEFVAKKAGVLYLAIAINDNLQSQSYRWTGNYKAKIQVKPAQ